MSSCLIMTVSQAPTLKGGALRPLSALRVGHLAWHLSAVFFALLFFMHQLAHFKNRDCRQHANEQQHAEQEPSARPDVRGPVPERWVIRVTLRRDEIAMKAGDDDDEALQPHADVHDDGNDPDNLH